MASYHKELLSELKKDEARRLCISDNDRVWSLRIQLQFGREWWAVAGDMGRSWFVNCDISGVGSNDWFRGGKHQKRDVKGEDTRMIETSLSFKEINFDPWIFVQSSWQLVFWPPTGKCYQIFSQGPCPPTQVDRLPHQLLIMRMTFRSLDSPRTVRSQSAGKILFLSPKLFPQVSPDSTHPLAGHRSLLQVYLHPF